MLVAGAVADKAARQVGASEPVVLAAPATRFVGRGGEKLAAALDRFDVDVRGVHALDAGASTGGFTDCLLQAGAAQVTAVDVGHGQLDSRLRADPRVVVHERTNIRTASLADLGGEPFRVVVVDLSFISLRTVAPTLFRELAAPGATAIALVKPQFEAGRAEAARGRGVIRDPAVWARVLREVRSALTESGAAMMDGMVSPLRGAEGNVEFLVHVAVSADAPVMGDDAIDALVADAAGGGHADAPSDPASSEGGG